jgi:polysaccharide biosynthesis protein PslF
MQGHPVSVALSAVRRPRRSYAVLSTFPPTVCGLATFAAALEGEMISSGDCDVTVVQVTDMENAAVDRRVARTMRNGSARSIAAAVAELDRSDVVIVQHEFGIFGGRDGDEILEVIRSLSAPTIVTLHTVLDLPSPNQRQLLEAIVDAAEAVVVMTTTAFERLAANYDVDLAKVNMIPHGAVTPKRLPRKNNEAGLLLTWGLLGRGKGIELVIDALAELSPHVSPKYLVAGCTHPKVLAAEGEAYRNMLVERARDAGVGDSVVFDSEYRSVESLTRLISEAAVVVLPYESRNQVTSGVLVDAIAAGRPVIATAFPHAVEMLSSGAGLVVPHNDPSALAAAILRVLTEPGLAESMEAEAARLAHALGWPTVARQYRALAERLLVSVPVTTR